MTPPARETEIRRNKNDEELIASKKKMKRERKREREREERNKEKSFFDKSSFLTIKKFG